jgi:hypothetical protein
VASSRISHRLAKAASLGEAECTSLSLIVCFLLTYIRMLLCVCSNQQQCPVLLQPQVTRVRFNGSFVQHLYNTCT